MINYLKNTHLQGGRYRIESLIGSGGFGNTYLGFQVALGRKVAIKEFFMKEFCERDESTSQVMVHTESCRAIVSKYKQKFLKEAQMIASLKNDHIIQIHDIFEENNTAYYVMEYVSHGSLRDIVDQDGALAEPIAIKYISQIADALCYLHSRNILHLDIKPSNVLIDDDDKVLLIDFGISKHYDSAGGQTSTTPAGISKGYAPIEQYQQGNISTFTPSTDVYSLGATLYFLLTGEVPPEASIIYEDGLPASINTFKLSIRNTIVKAMSPRRKDRFQSIQDFINSMKTSNPSSSDNEETTINIEPSEEEHISMDFEKATIGVEHIAAVFAVIVVFALVVIFLTL